MLALMLEDAATAAAESALMAGTAAPCCLIRSIDRASAYPSCENPKPLVLLLPVNLLFRSLLTRAPKNAGAGWEGVELARVASLLR